MVEIITKIIEDMKGYDIVVYDYKEQNPWIDTMIVASSDNIRTVHAIADEIYYTLKNEHNLPVKMEKEKESKWVLIDVNDIIVHLFVEDERNFYDVDTLWNNVKKLRDDVNQA